MAGSQMWHNMSVGVSRCHLQAVTGGKLGLALAFDGEALASPVNHFHG